MTGINNNGVRFEGWDPQSSALLNETKKVLCFAPNRSINEQLGDAFKKKYDVNGDEFLEGNEIKMFNSDLEVVAGEDKVISEKEVGMYFQELGIDDYKQLGLNSESLQYLHQFLDRQNVTAVYEDFTLFGEMSVTAVKHEFGGKEAYAFYTKGEDGQLTCCGSRFMLGDHQFMEYDRGDLKREIVSDLNGALVRKTTILPLGDDAKCIMTQRRLDNGSFLYTDETSGGGLREVFVKSGSVKTYYDPAKYSQGEWIPTSKTIDKGNGIEEHITYNSDGTVTTNIYSGGELMETKTEPKE